MLAVAGGKGGVGKTTTSLGLAAALPGRPLVVDTDRDAPNLAALAGVADATELDKLVDGAGRPAVAADTDCRVVDVPARQAGDTELLLTRLRRWLADGGADRDSRTPLAPVLDCPSGASVDAATPLAAADAAVLVTTACAPALRDTAKTAAMARTVGTPVLGAVLTRTAVRPPGVGDALGCDVLGCVPDRPPRPLSASAVRTAYERVAARLDGATP